MTQSTHHDADNSQLPAEVPNESVLKTEPHARPARRKRVPIIKRITKTIDKYGPLLTIAAMLIAIFELYVVHRSANEIDNLSRAAATRYISTFPGNMPELTKMIETTERELIIACDFAAYGHFSSPQEFGKYSLALQGLAKSGKSVKIICYNSDRAAKAREEQSGKDWEKIKSRKTFKDFFSNHPSPPQTLEEFFAFLQKRDLKFKCDMAGIGIDVQETGKDLPAFFWISDGNRAMFSFYAYGDDPREMSVQTIDSSLLRTFVEVTKQIKSDKFNYQGNCSGPN